MNENVIALNSFDSHITTDHRMCKMGVQTSCIFVPSIPGMLLIPQNVMYIQKLMSLLKGISPTPT